MKMICWLSGHRPQYRSCTANRTLWYLARSQSSVFWGDTKTWVGGCLRSQDLTNSECSSDLVNILLQILRYPSLEWILPSNLEVKTKKIKKTSSSQNLWLLDYVHLICLAVSYKKVFVVTCFWAKVC